MSAQDFWNRWHASGVKFRGIDFQFYSGFYDQVVYKIYALGLDLILSSQGFQPKGSIVLDVGSGRGFFLNYFVEKGSNVEGLDISTLAVQRLRSQFPNIEIHVGKVEEFKVSSNIKTYDLISAFALFYHILSDEGLKVALSNLSAMIKPRGLLVFSEHIASESETCESFTKHRSLQAWESLLDSVGLKLAGIFLGPAIARRNRVVDLIGAIEGRNPGADLISHVAATQLLLMESILCRIGYTRFSAMDTSRSEWANRRLAHQFLGPHPSIVVARKH